VIAASALWVRQGVLVPEIGVALAAVCAYALGWALLRRAHSGGGLGRARVARLERELEERSASEQLARHHGAVLGKALGLAKVGSWRWSIEPNQLIECSDSFARVYGMSRDEIFGLTLHGHDELVHPDDRQRVAQTYLEAEASGLDYDITFRVICPDGELRHVREIGEAVRDASGRVTEHIGATQDITEIKRIEEALKRSRDELELRVAERTEELHERETLLRTAARLSRMGTAIWDQETMSYASVSEECAQIFGCSSVDEYIERYGTWESDDRDMHPDDLERIQAFDQEFQASPHEAEIEYRFVIPHNKQVRYIRDILRPVYDDTGKHVRTIYAVQDITDLKHTEEQLRHAQKMEAVGQLTGGVAHDFNNLLAVILGNLELIELEVGEGGEAPEWIQRAIAATERGASLTQRLLAFSRKQALRPESVDVHQLVKSMLDLLRRTLGETIEVEVVGGVELWLSRIDPGQLENSILNLAINARDAMSGGGKLVIETSNVRVDEDYSTAETELEPGQYVLVAVRDCGDGMSAEVAAQAFEPFFTTKDVGEGSGLGLSMVYGFVKQSGGHAVISSVEGQGTTVELYLPRYVCGEAEAAVRPQAEPRPRARGERVLVVEDDAEVRVLILRVLTSLGYEVRDASSARAALEVLESEARVDLLLTDVVLPGGTSGRELAEMALQRRPNLPVLYMSGYTEDAVVQHGQLEDGLHFLQKPFRIGAIAQAVRQALADASSEA
jgi:PAS domain S-box-containing protein